MPAISSTTTHTIRQTRASTRTAASTMGWNEVVAMTAMTTTNKAKTRVTTVAATAVVAAVTKRGVVVAEAAGVAGAVGEAASAYLSLQPSH